MTFSDTTHSEAYHTGWEAHERGEPRTAKANPYLATSWNSDEWFAGWDAAKSLEIL